MVGVDSLSIFCESMTSLFRIALGFHMLSEIPCLPGGAEFPTTPSHEARQLTAPTTTIMKVIHAPVPLQGYEWGNAALPGHGPSTAGCYFEEMSARQAASLQIASPLRRLS